MVKLLLSFSVLMPVASWASIQNLSTTGGQVEILAIGKPSFIKIHGTGSAPSGHLSVDGDKVSGQFEFELNTLDTGIETRNEHMKKKYLEVEKYPKARLQIANITTGSGWSLNRPQVDGAEFNGTLTLHGVTQPVQGKFSMNQDRSVAAQFKVKLSAFGVEIPTYVGVTVADDVEIKVKIDKITNQ